MLSYSFLQGRISWKQGISSKISWKQEISWKNYTCKFEMIAASPPLFFPLGLKKKKKIMFN